MKRLAVLRRAKSSWAEAGMDDFDRPLNERGRNAARRIGEELAARKLRFDLVLASKAVRVRETVAEVSKAYDFGSDVRYVEGLYDASEELLMAVVRAIPEKDESVLLVGHNPGLQQLLATLTRADPNGYRERVATKFPTAALAVIELSVDQWEQVIASCGEIVDLILPRELD